MAFQAGGPHALDRALEAIAYAYAEMTRHAAARRPGRSRRASGRRSGWTKTFTVVPRGVALVIGCNTFPTWNSYPGLFACLVTGNAGRRQAAPAARCCRWRSPCRSPARCWPRPASTRTSSRWPPRSRARAWPRRSRCGPRCKLIDFTGSHRRSATGWSTTPARRRSSPRRPASTPSSSTRPTTSTACAREPRLLAVALHRSDVHHAAERLRARATASTTDDGPQDRSTTSRRTSPPRSTGCSATTRGPSSSSAAIVNDGVLERLDAAPSYGDVVLASRAVTHPDFPDADRPHAHRRAARRRPTATSTCRSASARSPSSSPPAAPSESIDLFRDTVRDHGAHHRRRSTPPTTRCSTPTEEAALDAGVALSENLTETASSSTSRRRSATSTRTGANPAANAALTDAAYVANRFRIVQSRRHLPPED